MCSEDWKHPPHSSVSWCFGFFFFFLLIILLIDWLIDWLIFGCAGSLLLHGLFSSCRERGLLSSCGTWASHCSGFSCWGAQTLGHTGFVAGVRGLSSCGFRALEHRLNSCAPRASLLYGMWDLPGYGTCVQYRDCVSCTGRRTLYHWATREARCFDF